MKKILVALSILFSSVFLASSLVFALSEKDIVFPVSELGGCQSEQECRTYCDQPDNFAACFTFAKKYNLLEGPVADVGEEGDIEQLSRVLQEKGGPGNCKSQSACETYCNDTNHIKECVAWAEKHDAIPKEKLEEAKRVQAAIEAGAKPPACHGRQQCEQYCQAPEHQEECLNFAEKAGFIPKEQVEHQRKMMQLMREGKMPGNCQGKEACETYCHQEDHFEECIKFAEENGFASQEEIQRFKETGGKGPGGCRGREQCDIYCRDENHQEECFEFGKKHGFIKEEDIKNREEGRQRFQEGLQRIPPEIAQCLKEAVGSDVFEKITSGQTVPTRELGEKMKGCFEQFAGQHEGNINMNQDREKESDYGHGAPGDKLPMRSLPPEIATCVRETIGEEKFQQLQSGAPQSTADLEPIFRNCFEKLGGNPPSLPPQPTADDFCKLYPEKCRQQQPPMPTNSQEEFCRQYPEKCNNVQQRPTDPTIQPDIKTICGDEKSPYYNERGCEYYRETGALEPTSFAPPTLGQFTVGLLYSLFTNLLK